MYFVLTRQVYRQRKQQVKRQKDVMMVVGMEGHRKERQNDRITDTRVEGKKTDGIN